MVFQETAIAQCFVIEVRYLDVARRLGVVMFRYAMTSLPDPPLLYIARCSLLDMSIDQCTTKDAWKRYAIFS